MNRGPLTEKILKKVSQCRKNWKGEPFGISQYVILLQNSKKNDRGPFEKTNTEKISQRRKTERGPFSLVRCCMLRGKPFWFSSLGQQVQFGVFLKFHRTFGVELCWSLQVYRKKFRKNKKKLTKSHDYSRLFSLEKRRQNKGPFGLSCAFANIKLLG